MTDAEKIEKARDILVENGPIDGPHHKMWTIDQAIRVLLGDDYEAFIKEYEQGGRYEWDTGIAP